MTVLAFDPANRATLTTLDKNNTRLTGNHAGAYQMARSNASIKNGQKRYWHYIMDAGDGSENWTTFTTLNGTRTVGVVNGAQGFASGQYPGISTNSYGWYGVNGNKYYNNILDAASPPALGTAFSSYAHSMFSIAVDRVANKAYIGIGPIWRATFNPIAGTNGYAIEVAGTDDHYAAAAVFTGGNRIQLSTWPRLQPLEDISYLPLGYETGTITYDAEDIVDQNDDPVTESNVIASVHTRAGAHIDDATVTLTAGGGVVALTSDLISEGQTVVTTFWNSAGTLRTAGVLGTVVLD